MIKKQYTLPCSEEQRIVSMTQLLVGSTMPMDGGGKQTGARTPRKVF